MGPTFEDQAGGVPFVLPQLGSFEDQSLAGKDRAGVALRLLRQAAIANRQSKGLPFYSIRTVAKHFSLPATTVTRLYGQLKKEGILGGIWGSKTIVEPSQLDNDVRLKAVVALPVPVRAFSAVSAYRYFVRAMQRALARERFGSQIVFYDETMFEGSTVTDALLESGGHIVVWLMPPTRTSNCFARLKDRGLKLIVITDGMPINGETGYYLNWQDAVLDGLAAWKVSGNRKVFVAKDSQTNTTSGFRLLYACLSRAGFAFEVRDKAGLQLEQPGQDAKIERCGVIFLSAESLIQFAQVGVPALEHLLQYSRALFIHGSVDLPYQTHLNRRFDTINFDWQSIARRVVRDLVVSRWVTDIGGQTIFKARWGAGACTLGHS